MIQPENPFKVTRSFGIPKVVNEYHMYFDGTLGDPEDYREEFELIRHMGEGDILYNHYNGLGGNSYTMIQFLRCFQDCKGTIVGSIEGQCESAYGFMFLHSDGFEVSDHIRFMCHNYNGGLFGSGHELKAELEFDGPWAENLMRTTYEGFLSIEEINLMLEGKIYYFDMDEVVQRCEVMMDFRLEVIEQREREEEVAQTPPKKAKRKLKANVSE